MSLRLALWTAGGPVAVFGFLMVFAVGVVIGGGLGSALDEGDLRFAYLPLAVYMLVIFLGTGLERLPAFDPLPISRRLQLSILAAPLFVALIAGYGAGHLLDSMIEPSRERVAIDRQDNQSSVVVPAGFWEIAWDGEPPVNASPWGESHPARKVPLFQGLTPVIYSPFASSEATTPEYFAWEIGRALEAVYGRTVAHSEILERYFEPSESGILQLREVHVGFRSDLSSLATRSMGPVFPVLMTVILVPSLWLIAIVLLTFRARVSSKLRRTVFWGLAFAVLSLVMAWLPLAIGDWIELWVLRGFGQSLIRHLGSAPWGHAAAWIVGSILIVASSLPVLWTFQRAELPSKPKFGRGAFGC